MCLEILLMIRIIKIDTSFFVQKSYLRSNYIEANIEEDIDLKNQFRIKNLPDPISITEACSKNYVGNATDEISIVREIFKILILTIITLQI